MNLLQNYEYEALSGLVRSLGQPAFRTDQLYRWLNLGCAFSEMTNLPKAFLDQLEKGYTASSVSIMKRFDSGDGSKKYLLNLTDGRLIECVLMPHDYGNTLCISTQVGCRMGCLFCASTVHGLERNLSAGEMLGQIALVNRDNGGDLLNRRITNIVLMGSGEPLDNYENVLQFLKLVTDARGLNISIRNISLSTCGLPAKIRDLADAHIPLTLSLSLHATTDEIRNELMPVAKRYTIHETIDAVRYYFQQTGRRVIIEYILLEGKNMNFFDASRLKELTKGYSAHINLIELNGNRNGFTKASKLQSERFCKRLREAGLSVSIRKSFGGDIEGACGQLRNKFVSDSGTESSDKKSN